MHLNEGNYKDINKFKLMQNYQTKLTQRNYLQPKLLKSTLNNNITILRNYNSNKNQNKISPEEENEPKKNQKTFEFGDVIFTSDFNSGNMTSCSKINNNIYSVYISPDCDGFNLSHPITTFKIWFYFGVKSIQGQKIFISIENLNNFYKLFLGGYKITYLELPENVTPSDYQNSYYEDEEYDWKRLDINYEIKLDEISNNLKVGFYFNLPKNKYVLFSYCYPWSYEKNEYFLEWVKNIFEKDSNIYYYDEILTLSLEKRNLHLLTITSKINVDKTKTEPLIPGIFPGRKRNALTNHDRHIIFITGRVHPGETPGSLMMNGILKMLAFDKTELSKLLLDNFVFKIIPIINVDGVSHGYFRLNQEGLNLNRCYLNPDQLLTPENFAITKMFFYYSNFYKIRYYFDLHADMNCRGVYTFGNALSNFEEHVENVLFSFIYKLVSPHVNFCHCIFSAKSMTTKAKNDIASKEGTSRVHFYKKTGLIHTYTIESSYYKGNFNNENSEIEEEHLYDFKDIEDSGKGILLAILNYEELYLSENIIKGDYLTIGACRKHIAQTVKFNEDRFKFDYSLREIINNIDECKKWLSIKDIKNLKNKFVSKRKNFSAKKIGALYEKKGRDILNNYKQDTKENENSRFIGLFKLQKPNNFEINNNLKYKIRNTISPRTKIFQNDLSINEHLPPPPIFNPVKLNKNINLFQGSCDFNQYSMSNQRQFIKTNQNTLNVVKRNTSLKSGFNKNKI